MLESLAEAMVPLQRQLEGAGVSILATAPVAKLAMLQRMSAHVGTWLLGCPAGNAQPMSADAACVMPPMLHVFHQVAAAAVA